MECFEGSLNSQTANSPCASCSLKDHDAFFTTNATMLVFKYCIHHILLQNLVFYRCLFLPVKINVLVHQLAYQILEKCPTSEENITYTLLKPLGLLLYESR